MTWTIVTNFNFLLFHIQILSLQKSLREVCLSVPAMQSLILTGCYNLTDDRLCSALRCSLKELQELNLSMCKQLTDRAVLCLCQFLPQLVSLDLGGCSNLTDNALSSIERGLLNLQHLNLRSCRNLSDSGIALLCRQVTTLPGDDDEQGEHKMEIEQESEPTMNKGLTKLKSLGLQDCQKLSDDALKYVAAGLPQLEKLNLSFCSGLSEFVLKYVADLRHLQRLNLRSCSNVTEFSLRFLADAVLPELRHLDVSFCEKVNDAALGHVAQGMTRLHTLCLNSCSISDSGLLKVAQNCTQLQTLNVGQCTRIGDKSVQALAANCPLLCCIDLYGCTRVTDVALEKLMQLPALKQLNRGLQNNQLPGNGRPETGDHQQSNVITRKEPVVNMAADAWDENNNHTTNHHNFGLSLQLLQPVLDDNNRFQFYPVVAPIAAALANVLSPASPFYAPHFGLAAPFQVYLPYNPSNDQPNKQQPTGAIPPHGHLDQQQLHLAQHLQHISHVYQAQFQQQMRQVWQSNPVQPQFYYF